MSFKVELSIEKCNFPLASLRFTPFNSAKRRRESSSRINTPSTGAGVTNGHGHLLSASAQQQ